MQLPMHFEVEAEGQSGMQNAFTARAHSLNPITCAIPTEFGGPGRGYSPEDLFALSLVSCFIATFKVFAEKSKLTFEEIAVKAVLTIAKNQSGVLALTKLDIQVDLQAPSDHEKAMKLMHEADKYCLISNAVKVEKQFSFNIS